MNRTGPGQTAGPVYREGADQFRELVVRMPNTARYQPREVSVSMLKSQIKPEPIGPRGLPERVVKFAPEQEKSYRARAHKRTRAERFRIPAKRTPRAADPNSLTQRILAVLRGADTRMTAAQIGALVGRKGGDVSAGIVYWVRAGEVVSERGPDGLTDYALASRIADGSVVPREAQAPNVDRLARSLTTNILLALADGGLKDRAGILADMPVKSWTLDEISNRMSALKSAGRIAVEHVPDTTCTLGWRAHYRLATNQGGTQ